ncbi:MAG: hypothetical protein IT287_06925 [Bdellovibrionaceae bacterium]|nr:hypothetical protein [Pseudobdellovibrionaceae bacterium]
MCGSLNVTVIHLIDFLKYIDSPIEIITFPYLGFAAGLYIRRKFFLGKAHFLLIAQFLILPSVLYFLAKIYFLVVLLGIFFSIGLLISSMTADLNKNRTYYVVELFGWIFGAVLTYLLIPLLGIERLYVLYLMVAIALACIKIKNTTLRFYLVLLVLIGPLFFIRSKVTIYDYVQKIENPRKKERTNTFWNAKYALVQLGGELIESQWTDYSKLDVIKIKEQKYVYMGAEWALPINDEPLPIGPSNTKKSLVLGVGTGVDLSLLEKFGYREIVGIEIIPELVAMMKSRYAVQLFSRHKVIASDGRYYLRNAKDKFSFILHSYPDLPSNYSADGMPYMNSLDFDEAFVEAYNLLERNGLFVTKLSVRPNRELSGQIWPLILFLKNIPKSSIEQVMVYSGEEALVTKKKLFLVIVKNGKMNASDQLEIDKIYDKYKKMDEHQTKALIADIRTKWLPATFSVNSMEQFKFNNQVGVLYFVSFVVLFLCLYFMRPIINSKNDYAFLSGLFFVILQTAIVIKASFYMSNISLSYVLVISAMAISAGVSLFFIKKSQRYKFLEILSPAVAVVATLILFYVLEERIFANNMGIIFIAVLFAGLFSSYNYSLTLSKVNKQFSNIQAKNILGCVFGTLLSVLFFRLGLSVHWLLSIGMLYSAVQISYSTFKK